MEFVRQKNIATYVYFPLVDADGDPVTGASGMDSNWDGYADGTVPNGFTACTNEATEIGTTGAYYLLLTATEMNNDYVLVYIAATGAKTQWIAIRTIVGDPSLLATTASGALVWSSATRALTTPADYKADVSNLDAAITTRAPANEYDTELDVVLSTRAPANEYDVQLDANVSTRSSHSAANVWAVGTRVITGGVLTTPGDYKADVTDMATNTNVDANETKIDTVITDIGNLNNLAGSDIQTVLETNDLDHLIKIAHPTGDPVQNSLMDLIMNKDGTQTFARADDSLQGISEGAAGGGASAQEVWEYASPRTLTTPNDYKADVTGLAPSGEYDTELKRLLGLADEDCYIDNYSVDGSGRMTGCRKRVYDSRANAITHGVTGLLDTYQATVTYDNGNFESFLMTRE